MTTPPSFPTLAGQGWSVHKKPMFSTIVAPHVSGREVRDALYQNPIWQFELVFDGLTSNASGLFASGLGGNSLQALMGLFLQCQGQYGTFLYTDPTDSSAASSTSFATGDGVTTAFTLSRFLGPFLEPVGWVTALTQVEVAGSVLGSGWSLSAAEHAHFHQSASGRRGDRRDLLLCLPVPVRRRRPGFRAIHGEPLEGGFGQVPLGADVVTPLLVIPAQAGIQGSKDGGAHLDPSPGLTRGLRGGDR